MLAVLLLVTVLAPAVLLASWRRPTPARVGYLRMSRTRSRHAR